MLGHWFNFFGYPYIIFVFTFQDAETFLTYNWIQEEIFESLLSNLPRALFFKLCRMIHYRYSESYTGTYHFSFCEISFFKVDHLK